MKKPLLTTLERYSLREHPNSFLAAWARKDIATARLKRELHKAFRMDAITDALQDDPGLWFFLLAALGAAAFLLSL